MTQRDHTIEFHMNYCQHYDVDGVKITCKVGHNIDGYKNRTARPCIKGHARYEDPCSVCPDWIRNTRESAEKRADGVQNSMDGILVVLPAIQAWREKEPIGKSEVIECPVCKGELQLSQAACNGHVHGKCKTKDCVNWME